MQDDRVTKIQALLRKAESTEHQEEADALFAKAQQLMTMWAIDDALLDTAASDTQREEVIEHRVALRKSYYKVDALLLDGVARANNCRVLMTDVKMDRGVYAAFLLGHRSDVQRVESLFNSLMLQMTMALRQAADEAGIRGQPQKIQHPWYRSFREGYAVRIAKRLSEANQEAAESHSDDRALPALQDRSARVDNWVEDNYNVRAGRRSQARRFLEASMAGRKAADNADIGQTRVEGDSRDALPG